MRPLKLKGALIFFAAMLANIPSQNSWLLVMAQATQAQPKKLSWPFDTATVKKTQQLY